MSVRMDRVASLLREEISIILQRELPEPGDGFMTVTDVRMTPDLKIAKVYVSILGSHEVREKTMKMLENQKSHIRGVLGSRIRLKFTPSIHFYQDETLDNVERINNLIRKTHDRSSPDGER